MSNPATSQNPDIAPRFYSVHAAARILGVSAMTLYREIAEGAFPAVRIRNRLIIPAKVVDEMAQAAIDNHSAVDARDWVANNGPLPRPSIAKPVSPPATTTRNQVSRS